MKDEHDIRKAKIEDEMIAAAESQHGMIIVSNLTGEVVATTGRHDAKEGTEHCTVYPEAMRLHEKARNLK